MDTPPPQVMFSSLPLSLEFVYVCVCVCLSGDVKKATVKWKQLESCKSDKSLQKKSLQL